MKKLLIYLFVAIPAPCMAAVQIVNMNNDGLDHLRVEISKLEQQLAQKTEQLNKCAAKNNNFKIAGIATVGLATAGVATNIALHSKTQNQKKQIENMENQFNNAERKANGYLKEMKTLFANRDPDKCRPEFKNRMTDAELQRLKELSDNPPDEPSDEPSESDIALMKKIIQIMRDCQK